MQSGRVVAVQRLEQRLVVGQSCKVEHSAELFLCEVVVVQHGFETEQSDHLGGVGSLRGGEQSREFLSAFADALLDFAVFKQFELIVN